MVWSCIEKYLKWSGHEINIFKYGLIFSKNFSLTLERVIGIFFDMEECIDDIMYLENPLIVGRNRYKAISFLKKEIHVCLKG